MFSWLNLMLTSSIRLIEASEVYKKVIGDGKDCVIKAMVLTGGRGLGHFDNGFKGGVHLCSKPGDVQSYASKMLGQRLITKQTTAEGLPCSKVMLVERMFMRREMYISIMLDRAAGGPIFIASPSGGTSIEDVAAATPELIFKQPIDIMKGMTDENANYLATSLGFTPGSKGHAEAKAVVEKLYKLFITHDCTLVEVNPLAETSDERVVVCDAKVNFDDNAEFRQKEIFKLRDRTQEDSREVEAAKYDLNYIGLTGNIGCMVNGAGLAMATMDIIKLKGGDPANFLDVGGGASENQVQKAFELLNADKRVKAILVNIFGGIMRCDVIAMGVIHAAQAIGMKKPIIIRLKGTNVDEAKKLIEASGIRMIVTDDLEDAANKAVHVADIVRQAEEVALSVQFGGADSFMPHL
jgi:succinyl-CoA synthetase beta subunit